jgi:hypothetical protein
VIRRSLVWLGCASRFREASFAFDASDLLKRVGLNEPAHSDRASEAGAREAVMGLSDYLFG